MQSQGGNGYGSQVNAQQANDSFGNDNVSRALFAGCDDAPYNVGKGSGNVSGNGNGNGNGSQSSPFGNSNASPFGSGNVDSGMFGSGDSSFTFYVKQNDSHILRQFQAPAPTIDPLLQWKTTLEYLSKIGDACRNVDSGLTKLKDAKARLIKLAVPAWAHKKKLSTEIKNLPAAAIACHSPSPAAVFDLAKSFISSADDASTFDMITDKVLQAIHDAELEREDDMDLGPAPATPTTSKPHVPDCVTPGLTPQPKSKNFNIAASESGEDAAPEKLDFEGGSGMLR